MNLGLGPRPQAEHRTPLIPSYFSIAHLDYLQAGHSQVSPASNSNLATPLCQHGCGKGGNERRWSQVGGDGGVGAWQEMKKMVDGFQGQALVDDSGSGRGSHQSQQGGGCGGVRDALGLVPCRQGE